ncbi:MAG: PASTA domain-containing protein [Acidobacteria bacterium]|nr:PASTA domain-containing protein [Acidobacteriota bacterium]
MGRMLLPIFLFFIVNTSVSSDEQNPIWPQDSTEPGITDTERERRKEAERIAMPLVFPSYSITDPKVAVANLLLDFKHGHLSAQDFYKKLSLIELPKEPRFFLMELKTEVETYRGTEGVRYLFGDSYKGGSTYVEHKLLSWRRDFVYETIKDVVAEFRGRNVIDGFEYKVFLAEIGGWAKENWDQMKLAGDIDFSFVSGNRDLALAMKQRYDALVSQRVGMSADSFDAVCTAHGMATPEVYVGEHGKIFAERAMEANTDEATSSLREIDLEKGSYDQRVTGRKVLDTIVLQAKMRGIRAEIAGARHPTEPGISMEMIRHFKHDIVHNPVYTDLESFMKAAKYMNRSDTALNKAFQMDPSDPKLAAVVESLTNAKGKGVTAQIEILRNYFGGELPYNAKLGPTRNGQSQATIESNQRLISEFWKSCETAMWRNANRGFQAQIDQLKSEIFRVGDNLESATRAADLLYKVREMMEIELRVLEDPKLGTAIPEETHRIMDDLRSTCDDFNQKWGRRLAEYHGDTKYFRFMEDNLRSGRDLNIKLAISAVLHYADKGLDATNQMLDFVDNTVMGDIRGERGDWQSFLKQHRETHWATKVNKFVGRDILSAGEGSYTTYLQSLKKEGVESINNILLNNLPVKVVRDMNQSFSRSVQGSRGGQLTMKGLMVFSLSTEIPAYIEAYKNEGWNGVAIEFIRRRVPFGAVVDDVVMGRYYLALFDTVTLFLPPAALFQAAASMGDMLGNYAWQWYWSSELDLFVDELYAGASFLPDGVDRIGDALSVKRWRLATITYRDTEIDVNSMIAEERRQIAEMKAACRVPPKERVFPMQYVRDGISDWTDADNALRENLVDRDAYLVMIEGMKAHPDVGPKLKDHYLDLFYTRFEQVKLAFVQELRKRFEDRYAVQAADAAGQIPELDSELRRIARELKISQQVDAELKKAVGGTIGQFLDWMRDRAVNVKRDFKGQPPTEDAYQEGSRILLRFVRLYSEILKARGETEEAYVSSPKEDYGLRILTTPYLLTGNPEKDEGGFQIWTQAPAEIQSAAVSELSRIKNSLGAGPLGREDFDRTTLEQITSHDIWKRLWRHVQWTTAEIRTGAGIFSYEVWLETWEQSRTLNIVRPPTGDADSNHVAENDQADQLDGLGNRDLPLDRFRAHDAARERLVARFIRHYLSQQLDALKAEAEKTGEEIQALCLSIQAGADLALIDALSITKAAERLADTASLLDPRIQGLSQQATAVLDAHAAAEKQTTTTGETANDLDRTGATICRNLETAKATDNLEARRRILEQMQPFVDRLRTALAQAKTSWQQTRESSVHATSAWSIIESTIAELETTIEVDRQNNDLNALDASLLKIEQQLHDLSSRISKFEEIRKKADTLFDRARVTIESLGQTEISGPLMQTVESEKAAFDSEFAGQHECSEQARLRVESVRNATISARNDLERARTSLAALENKAHALNSQNMGLRAKAEAADYLFSLADSYRRRAEEAADTGALCYALAEDLMQELRRLVMPDLRGISAAGAKAKLETMGVNPTWRAGEPAPSAKLSFAVSSQMPAPGTGITSETPVIIIIFGEHVPYVAPDVIGMKLDGAKHVIRQSGFVPVVVAGDAAPEIGLEGTVQSQQPEAGRTLGANAQIMLKLYGKARVAPARANNIVPIPDCSQMPGTELVWSEELNAFKCLCPDPSREWHAELRACATPLELDCARLATLFNRQMAAHDKKAADITMNQGRKCSWHPENAGHKDFILEQAGPSRDCEVLGPGFWKLMIANRTGDARAVLVQSTHCDFHKDGMREMKKSSDIKCMKLEGEILDASVALNLSLAQNRIRFARDQGCTVTEDTVETVQKLAELERDRRAGYSSATTEQVWTSILQGLAQMAGMQPGIAEAESPARPDRPHSGGSGSGIGTFSETGANEGGTEGAGKSSSECEKLICGNLCDAKQELDLMSHSFNPQCNECREINGPAIQACIEGRPFKRNPKQTTGVYRVSCSRRFDPELNRMVIAGCGLLNPEDAVPEGDIILYSSRSWRDCWQKKEEYNRTIE